MTEDPRSPTTDPTYHWLEWPMAVVVAVLLVNFSLHEPGESREEMFMLFQAALVILMVCCCYADWRRGALSHPISKVREGLESGAEPFARMHRRAPLGWLLIAMGVVGHWIR
jgi:hypothetical protein